MICLPFKRNKVYVMLHLWYRTCSAPFMTLVSLRCCQRCPPAEYRGRWKETDGHVNRLHSTGVTFFWQCRDLCTDCCSPPTLPHQCNQWANGRHQEAHSCGARLAHLCHKYGEKNKMCAQAICYWMETLDNILPVHFLLPPIAAVWRLLCTLYIHETTLGVIMRATLNLLNE